MVGDDNLLIFVDHAEPKRHVVHGGVEPLVLLAHQRAETVVTPAGDPENEIKQDHQPDAYGKRAKRHGQHAGLNTRQFVETLHRRGMMGAGSRKNLSFHDIEFGVDVGSIEFVGAGDVAGIDRREHAIDGKQIFLVYRKHIADQRAVGGVA